MLSNKEIRALQPNAKPDGSHTDKSYRIGCGKGLLIQVHPNGGKYWRFKYRYDRKQKTLSLGVFPDVAIEAAIIKRDEFRALLKEHIDPSEVRKQYKAERLIASKAEKMASRFLYSENGDLLIRLNGHQLLLTSSEARDLKKFLNSFPAEDV